MKKALAAGQPVIPVDTNKKEILGNYNNGWGEWRPAKQPRHAQGHDFPGPDVPRSYPYGIHDIGKRLPLRSHMKVSPHGCGSPQGILFAIERRFTHLNRHLTNQTNEN